MNRMKFSPASLPDRLHLRLPATSANLGPCFDAAALAIALYLDVCAVRAQEFSIEASGRDPEICGKLEGNLLIDTYSSILKSEGREVSPLALTVENGIPLGMGCGSSAAVRIAAVALAAHFGQLEWDDDHILATACDLEGHPDPVLDDPARVVCPARVVVHEPEHEHAEVGAIELVVDPLADRSQSIHATPCSPVALAGRSSARLTTIV